MPVVRATLVHSLSPMWVRHLAGERRERGSLVGAPDRGADGGEVAIAAAFSLLT